MEKQLPSPNPGIIWTNSKIIRPDDLSRATFTKWYSRVHLPDVLKTGAFSEANRWVSHDPKREEFHLALYYAPNMEGLLDKVKTVPLDQHIQQCVFFDTRFYKLIRRYQSESAQTETPDFCLSFEMTPADADEYDRWYREEHLQDGAKIKGWRRTERYELLSALRTPDSPRFLTLLFLDGDVIPTDDLARAGSSNWTQKILGSMRQLRSVAFRKAEGDGSKL